MNLFIENNLHWTILTCIVYRSKCRNSIYSAFYPLVPDIHMNLISVTILFITWKALFAQIGGWRHLLAHRTLINAFTWTVQKASMLKPKSMNNNINNNANVHHFITSELKISHNIRYPLIQANIEQRQIKSMQWHFVTENIC